MKRTALTVGIPAITLEVGIARVTAYVDTSAFIVPPVVGDWILAEGVWDDGGVWDDSAVWID